MAPAKKPLAHSRRSSSSRPNRKAIDAANNTEFGLASYFYSRDMGRIFRVGEALEYGMVGINVGILATEHVPFGGVNSPAWAAKAHTTAWMTTWKSGTCALATFRSDHPRRRPAPETAQDMPIMRGCAGVVQW